MLLKIVRVTSLALATAFAAVVLEPAASGFLLGLGVDTNDVAPWVSSTTDFLLRQPWFAPLSFLVIGATLGAWAERALLSSGIRPANRLHGIANDLRLSVEPLRRAQRSNYRISGGNIEAHAMNYRGALRSLEKAGFTVPWVEFNIDPIGFIDLSVQFVDKVAPLLLRGHTADAKRVSQ